MHGVRYFGGDFSIFFLSKSVRVANTNTHTPAHTPRGTCHTGCWPAGNKHTPKMRWRLQGCSVCVCVCLIVSVRAVCVCVLAYSVCESSVCVCVCDYRAVCL